MTAPTDAASGGSPEREEPVVHILWINAGLSCDGDSVALTAATQPSIEDIVLGALPGLPKVAVHWPLIDFESAAMAVGSKSISGQCTATLGSPGSAPSTMSSMLGWIAAVNATESPSQLSPALIHSMWTTGSSRSGEPPLAASVGAVMPPPHPRRCRGT